jgi:hypothetical protein
MIRGFVFAISALLAFGSAVYGADNETTTEHDQKSQQTQARIYSECTYYCTKMLIICNIAPTDDSNRFLPSCQDKERECRARCDRHRPN